MYLFYHFSFCIEKSLFVLHSHHFSFLRIYLLLFALTIGFITYKASKTILVSKVGLFISEQRWEVAKEIGEDMDYKHLEFQCLDPSF